MKLAFLLLFPSALLAADCDQLVTLRLNGAKITSAAVVPAGAFTPPDGRANAAYQGVPAFCRVQGVAEPSPDSHIEFETWLPAAWNGKYFAIGNGGFAGSIQYTLMAAALINGYASSSTDTGHKGPATTAEWALGHPEKVVDFAWRAIHETAEKSKAVIAGFYGRAARHSYFSACSNGGRQGLIEAQRFPADYDGIISGAPANFWTHNFAGFIWDQQALQGEAQIPASKMPAIENAALAACDANDGVKDGVIDDPTRCHFDPSVLLCKGAESDSCLSAPQIGALKRIYDGPKNAKGERIFPGYVPGGESGPGGWSRWVTGADSQQAVFGIGYFANIVFQNPRWDFRSFQFDRDMKTVDDQSARLFNATDPNLEPFKARGGKMFIYHGWSDTAIAPANAIDYYNSVASKMGSRSADAFLQLYMVPGMQHCAGGPGPDSFGANPSASPSDAAHSLSIALDEWVDHGVAPKQVIATKYSSRGPDAKVVRTRPLCPYPQTARYTGSGSTDAAASFRCQSDAGPKE